MRSEETTPHAALVGMLRCGDVAVAFSDSVTTHLEIVVVQHLRLGRPLHLSWTWSVASGSGRAALWMPADAAVLFTFDHARLEQIDRAWLDALHRGASSPGGMVVVDAAGRPVRGDADLRGLR